jgi:FkbM family methyltransferase
MELSIFNYGNYKILYPEFYFQFLKEVFILDVYRTNLLKPSGTVLDLGAGTGDFSIIASKKVGPEGRVIAVEPDFESYEILRLNIEQNNCKNVITLNLAVGDEELPEKQITFWGKTCICKVNTLENIVDSLKIDDDKIDFIKMDIEGFEADVIRKSIGLIKNTRILSIEFHHTKEKIHKLLLPHGFYFEPVTMRYIYKKIVRNLFLHPLNLSRVYMDTIHKNPHVLRKAVTGFDMTKKDLLIGSYIKRSDKDICRKISI